MLELLLIREGNYCYGVLLGQVASLSEDGGCAAATLGELLDAGKTAEKSGKMLRIKGFERFPVLIGEAEEISSVPLHEVRVLPEIIRASAGIFGIWALVWRQEGALLLLDFYRNSFFTALADVLPVGEEGGNDEKRS